MLVRMRIRVVAIRAPVALVVLAVTMFAGACGSATQTTSVSASVSASPSSTPAVGACPGSVEVVRRLGTERADFSTNWAGYSVSSSRKPFTCVEASWTQQSATCQGDGPAAVTVWVGIGGVGQSGLVQVGTQTSCSGGALTATAWTQSLPQQQYAVSAGLAVAIGDSVRGSVLWISGSTYKLSIENLSTGQVFSTTEVNGVLDPTSAEWIVEAPLIGCPTSCRVATLPDFGTVTLSNVSATVGGVNVPLDAVGLFRTRTTLVTSRGVVRARVSETSSNGRSFAVTWVRP